MADPIARYTFFPWVRQGLASRIDQVDTLGSASPLEERASVRVSFDVNAQEVSKDVLLVGPGDVVGINPRAVVRTEPRASVTDFEPNYLAAIEFYEEDFTHRHTPARATATHRLRPWIFLLVLKEGEFESLGRPGPLPAIRLLVPAGDVLPRADQAWAWAHVHASKDVTEARSASPDKAVEALEALLERNPDAALSRLMCPRRLEENAGYRAFVIPSFETGRLAGLGEPTTGVDAMRSSWDGGQVEFPVYYRWSFRTGERGDFEFLVNLLEPRVADERVGIREMDVQAPGFGVRGLTGNPDVGLEGALRAPNSTRRPETWPPANAATFVAELEGRINLQEDLLEDPGPGGEHPDPVIGPPLHGRWHAGARRLAVGEAGWVNELNGDPRFRAPAGFGAEAVRRGQEGLMQRAWAQLGDVIEANRRIRLAQLSILASHRVFERTFEAFGTEELLVFTHSVHTRVLGSPETIRKVTSGSRIPVAAMDPAFRRLTRPRGVILRKFLVGGPGPRDVLTRLNAEPGAGRIAAAPPKSAPPGQISFDEAAKPLRPPPLAESLVQHRFTVLLLLVLVGVVLLAVGSFAAGGALGAVAVGFAVATERIRRRMAAANRVRESALTVEAVRGIPQRPSFTLTEPDGAEEVARAAPGGNDSVEARQLRSALEDLHASFEIDVPSPALGAPMSLESTRRSLTTALDPRRSIPLRISRVALVPAVLAPDDDSVETVAPVKAHPVFADPMYAALRDISSELLVPNLHLIPDNTILLLETNMRFIESYMVGANHEMARELLWREYVTDQRGSYFRQFWDVGDALVGLDPGADASAVEEELRDIKPLHEWKADTALGTHANRPLPTGEEGQRLVLVIRGQLLLKYPTAVIYAHRAAWGEDEDGFQMRVLDETNPAANLLEPAFKAEVDPDLRFVGFDLTGAQARGSRDPEDDDAGWFFIIQERPGEPRFGLDLPGDETPDTPTKWDDLAWSHLEGADPGRPIDVTVEPREAVTGVDTTATWGSTSADMAYILYQVPVMVAFHADDMLPREGSG